MSSSLTRRVASAALLVAAGSASAAGVAAAADAPSLPALPGASTLPVPGLSGLAGKVPGVPGAPAGKTHEAPGVPGLSGLSGLAQGGLPVDKLTNPAQGGLLGGTSLHGVNSNDKQAVVDALTGKSADIPAVNRIPMAPQALSATGLTQGLSDTRGQLSQGGQLANQAQLGDLARALGQDPSSLQGTKLLGSIGGTGGLPIHVANVDAAQAVPAGRAQAPSLPVVGALAQGGLGGLPVIGGASAVPSVPGLPADLPINKPGVSALSGSTPLTNN
ncbi:hypothetical protein D5S17_28515 [Pseudonocardiaceae bacterium YIM PH 21723]|nr:hypothetical protein D5S17_28515 [Pseudonocardiaceae bacterium YIM PH 21723]